MGQDHEAQLFLTDSDVKSVKTKPVLPTVKHPHYAYLTPSLMVLAAALSWVLIMHFRPTTLITPIPSALEPTFWDFKGQFWYGVSMLREFGTRVAKFSSITFNPIHLFSFAIESIRSWTKREWTTFCLTGSIVGPWTAVILLLRCSDTISSSWGLRLVVGIVNSCNLSLFGELVHGKFIVWLWVINSFLMAFNWDLGGVADKELKLRTARWQVRWLKKRRGIHMEDDE